MQHKFSYFQDKKYSKTCERSGKGSAAPQCDCVSQRESKMAEWKDRRHFSKEIELNAFYLPFKSRNQNRHMKRMFDQLQKEKISITNRKKAVVQTTNAFTYCNECLESL